mgnify:CR=1 FL=1|tara:strand:- start:252 stop:1136 length:885 start_codon:yes stop_codon:yes gene_type:complete
MKFLVTGSSGFIGKKYYNFLLKEHGKENVFFADKNSGCNLIIQKDVDNLPDVDFVIHLAAHNGTKHFYDSPLSVIENSSVPTLNLLKRYSGKVKCFIYASTCEIYADATEKGLTNIPTAEDTPVLFNNSENLRWSYAASKYLGELAVLAAKKEKDQDYIIIRYHNIFGEDQVDHFIPEFAERAKQGDFSLYGWKNTRSFCYIDDAIRASNSLMFCKDALNKTIHLGNDEEISIKDVATKILKIMNINGELLLKEAPDGSVSRRCPDISLMKRLIKYRPAFTLEEGLKLTLKKYL